MNYLAQSRAPSTSVLTPSRDSSPAKCVTDIEQALERWATVVKSTGVSLD